MPFGYRRRRARLLFDVSLTLAGQSLRQAAGPIAAVPRPTPYLVLDVGRAVEPELLGLLQHADAAGLTLPLTLAEGDRVVLESAGAYTTAFSTVGFNGFPALPTVLR